MIEPSQDPESQDSQIDSLADEYLGLLRAGTAPPIGDFAGQHPEVALDLHAVLETLVALHQIVPQESGTTSSSQREKHQATFPKFDDYRLLNVAGQGGMGVVYEAIQVSLDRRVALKVLPHYLSRDLLAVERFRVEACAAAKLHHTNIVPVFEVGEQGKQSFYAMQFIDGESLDKVIRKLRNFRQYSAAGSPVIKHVRGMPQTSVDAMRCQTGLHSQEPASIVEHTTLAPPNEPAPVTDEADSGDTRPMHTAGLLDSATHLLDPSSTFASASDAKPFYRNVARLGRQVALALQHAHVHAVLHRDIKPANLMLDLTGNIWVTDFGLAKTETDELTRDGDVVGTLRYMAPERFSGTYDARSDIYSLGVTLYELIGLQPAFNSRDRLSLIETIKNGDTLPLRSLNRRIPYDLQTIVGKAMESQPARRYPSAQTMADDLQRFLDGQPIQARRVSNLERLWLWSHKNAALAASLAIVMCLLLFGAIGSTLAAIAQSHLALEMSLLATAKEAQSIEALKQRDIAFHNAYFADIRQAQQDWENGHTRRMLTTLQRYVPTGDHQDIRGWEWFYLLSLAHQDQTTISDFEGTATQIQWSRDGERIFSCGTDGTICVRNGQGKLLVSIAIPKVRQFALNYNDKQLATVSDDEVVRVWDTHSGELVQTIRLPQRQLVSVGWGKIPNLIVVAARPTVDVPGGEVILIDRITELVLQRHDSAAGIANWLHVNPQGDGLAVGGPGIGITIGFITQKDVIEIGASLFGHVNRVTCSAWHPDGRWIAVGVETRGVCVFEIDRNTLQPKLLFQTDDSATADAVAFSIDGKQLFVGNRSQRIDVYDLDSQQRTASFKGHLGSILSIAPHPSGTLLASSSADGTIKVWRTDAVVDAAEPVSVPQDCHGDSSDGSWKWQQLGNQVLITNAASGDELTRLSPFNGLNQDTCAPARVKLFPEVDRALFWPTPHEVGGPRRIWVCDTVNWKNTIDLGNVRYQAPWADLRGDFAIMAQNGVAKLFDGRTGVLHSVLVSSGSPPGLNDRIEDFDGGMVVILSPSGDRFVTCAGAEVKIWDSETRVELATLIGHRPGNFVSRLGWSNLGNFFATGATDQTIVLWDALRLRQMQTLRGLQDTPDTDLFGFNNDDSRFIAADSQNLKLWDVASGREVLSMERGPQTPSVFRKFVESDSAVKLGLSDAALRFEQLARGESLRNDRDLIDHYSHDTLLGLARYLVFSSPSDSPPSNPPERAIALTNQALKLKPTDAESLFLHALALYRADDFTESLRVLKLASDSGLADDYALKILRSLCLKNADSADHASAAASEAFEALNLADEIDLEHCKLVSEFAHAFLPSEQAHDKQLRIVVNSLQDGLDEDASTTSLREALLLAPKHATIEFNVSGTIELKFGPLEIQRSLQIICSGDEKIAISGCHKTRLLIVDDGDATLLSDVALSGIRFTAGRSQAKNDSRILEFHDGPRGSIYSHESLSISDCLLDTNHVSSGWGGAIYTDEDSVLKVIRTSFTNNSAMSGGALCTAPNSSVSIDSCTFAHNIQTARLSGVGSAIENGGMLRIFNSTFSQNGAFRGGAVDTPTQGNQVEIRHCTFTQNRGGAISTHTDPVAHQQFRAVIANCILWGNTNEKGEPLDILATDGVQADISQSIVGVVQGDTIDAVANLTDVDPKLASLADNGGPTQTHALLEGSPAIDAGSMTELKFDQRGQPYARTMNSMPDIGAFEYGNDAKARDR